MEKDTLHFIGCRGRRRLGFDRRGGWGIAVYQAVDKNQSANPILPTSNTSLDPTQTLTLSSTDVETAITQSVEKVGPAVVTIVGTIPGQMTFFGQTGDATVSGSGVFISDQGYILTTITWSKARRKFTSSSRMGCRKKRSSSARTCIRIWLS